MIDDEATADEAVRARPRYLQLADVLREDIRAGRLTVGKQFPTESELTREHGLSRYTVREALRRLEGEGLISRKRGSGTMIRPAGEWGGRLSQPLSNVGEIMQYAQGTRIHYVPRGVGSLPRKVRDRIEGTGGPWCRYHGTRLRPGDERPIAVTDAYVPEALLEGKPPLQLDGEVIFRQLEALCDLSVASITQEIQAVSASAVIAAELDIPRRAPCLRLLRCYYDTTGRLFEVSISHHPGDRFAYSMHIEVDG